MPGVALPERRLGEGAVGHVPPHPGQPWWLWAGSQAGVGDPPPWLLWPLSVGPPSSPPSLSSQEYKSSFEDINSLLQLEPRNGPAQKLQQEVNQSLN